MKPTQRLRWLGEYSIFRLITCMIEIMSVRQTIRLAEFMGWLFVHVLPRKMTRYQVAFDNIQTAIGDQNSPQQIEEIIEKMWVHLFRLVAEMVQFPRKLHRENYREVISFHNRRAAAKALNSGRPVFMLSGHFGNWEATTATFGMFGFPMGIVARKLDNPYLHQWFLKTREVTGHRLLLKRGSWDGISDTINAGGNLGLLCDQDAGKRGVFVDFFGKPASTFRSIALMAIENDALIVLGYGARLPDNHDESRWIQYSVGCETVIDTKEIQSDDEVRTITEMYTKALENVVRRHPEQYFWVHRRWKSVPRKKKSRKEKAA
jgi:Kdo2-lipid IVA lauroyltransferase/acyltransferase